MKFNFHTQSQPKRSTLRLLLSLYKRIGGNGAASSKRPARNKSSGLITVLCVSVPDWGWAADSVCLRGGGVGGGRRMGSVICSFHWSTAETFCGQSILIIHMHMKSVSLCLVTIKNTSRPFLQTGPFIFLGASAKLRRVTYLLHVRPSVWNVWALTGHFHKIWYLSIFRRSVQQIQVSLTYDKNNEQLARITSN